MTTECNQIDLVINLAEKMGNSLFFIPDDRDGNGRLVIWMSDPLTEDLKRKVNLENLKLEYWESKSVPHNPRASGYKCIDCDVVLAFPDKKTPKINSK